MDPITAIGLASGILTFITFSSGLVKGWKQIHESGSLEENATLGDVIGRMETLHSRLIPPDHENKQLSNDAKDLCELAKDCQKVSDALLKLLGKMKSSDSARGIRAQWQNLSATWHSLVHEKDKLQLEEELSRCHQRLTAVLAFLTRTKLDQLESLVRDNGEKFTQLQTNVRELNIELRKRTMDEEIRSRIESLVSAQEQTIKRIGYERILKSLKYSDMQKRNESIRQKLEEINEEQNGTRVTFGWILDQGEEGADPLDGDNEMDEGDDDETDQDHDENSDDEKDEENDENRDDEIDDGDIKHGDDETDSDDDKARENEKLVRDRARECFTKWLSTDGEEVFHILGKFGSGKSTLMQYLSDSPRTHNILQVWAGDRRLVGANFFFSTLIGGLQQLLTGLRRTLLYEILKQCPEMTSEVLSQAWKEAISVPWQMDTTVDIRSKDVSAALRKVIRRSHSSKTCFCFFIDGLDEFFDEDGLDKQDLVDLLNTWITDSKGNLKLCVASREEPEFKFSPNTTLRLHDLTHHDMRRFVQQRLHGKVDLDIKMRLAKIIPEKAQGIFLWVALVTRMIREEITMGGSPEDILDQLPPGLRPLLNHTINSIPEQRRLKAYLSFDMLLLLQHSSAMRSLSILAYSFLEDYCKNPDFSKQETGPWEQSDKGATEKIDLARTQLYGWCKGLLESRADHDGGEFVTFTHRSIREYLETDSIKQQFSLALQHHRAGNALIRLLIAEVRSRISRNKWDYENNRALTRLGLEELFDSERFEFLETMNSVFEKANFKTRPEDYSIYTYVMGLWTPLDYIFGKEYGYSYPNWRLECIPAATGSISEVKNLLCRLLRASCNRPLQASDSAFLDLLLKKGRSHLQTKTRFSLDSSVHTQVKMRKIDLNIWEHYLLAETLIRLAPPGDTLGYLSRSGRDHNFALVSESFLNAEADPSISITVTKCEDSEGKNLGVGGLGTENCESLDGTLNFEVGQEKTVVTVEFIKAESKWPEVWPQEWRRECKNWSLRDIFKRLEVPNKDTILELIDRSTLMREDLKEVSDYGEELQDSRHILEPVDEVNAGEVQPRWVPSKSAAPEQLFGFALGLTLALLGSLLVKLFG